MKENFFEEYFKGKKGLYACVAILFVAAFFVFKDFILLRNVFIYKDVASDSLNFSYAQLLNVSEYIRTQGFPGWSFNNGMGQNIFPLLLKDPTDLITFFLSRNSIAYSIIFKELFKIILSGVVFYLFLQKISLTKYTSIIGALLYSFTGFMILGSGWYIFTFEALMLASLLLAFEKLYQDNSWYLFPLIVMLLAVSMPFNLYVYGLFLVVYVFLRFLLEQDKEWKGLFILLGKLGGLTLLGLGMGAVFLFSNLKQMLESARVSGDTTYFNSLSNTPILGLADSQNYMTSILRFFSNDILGSGLNFKGWYNYLEAPLFYCGLITLILIPQAFVALNKKQKILYGVFIGIWLLPIIFPYFRYAFWLFTGDYYRAFSLCVDVCFLLVGLNALNYIERSGKVNTILLAITTIVLLIFLYYPYTEQQGVINKEVQGAVRNFLILYAGLIFLFGYFKSKVWVKVAILFIVFVELSYFSYNTVNKRRNPITSKELKQKVGFNDYTLDAVAYLNNTDKSFFRIDKSFSSSLAYNGGLNDPQAQFYKGTGSYHSFNQKYYLQFLNTVHVTNLSKDAKAELESKRIAGLINRPLLESLCSVKYFFTKQPNNTFMYATHDSVGQFGDIKVFKKKQYLPIGFAYDKYIIANDFSKMPDNQKDVMLFKAIVIDAADKDKYTSFSQLSSKDTVVDYSLDAYSFDISQLKKDTLALTEYNHNMLKGTIALEKRKALFFSIPYDIGWGALVDGQPADIQIADSGLMSVFIEPGKHTVELNYTIPYLKIGKVISGISVLLFLAFIVFSEVRKRKSSASETQAA